MLWCCWDFCLFFLCHCTKFWIPFYKIDFINKAGSLDLNTQRTMHEGSWFYKVYIEYCVEQPPLEKLSIPKVLFSERLLDEFMNIQCTVFISSDGWSQKLLTSSCILNSEKCLAAHAVMFACLTVGLHPQRQTTTPSPLTTQQQARSS